MRRWYVFDIETGPLGENELLEVMPPFDPSKVKMGNIKDPEKREAKLEDAELAHFNNFREKAALSPLTGRVIVIGVYDIADNRMDLIHSDSSEEELLKSWWSLVTDVLYSESMLVGVNIFGFDLPFLAQRSWALGVPIPPGVISYGSYNPWASCFVDLRKAFQLGSQCESSFDHIGRVLGTGGKCEGDLGARFHKIWLTDREMAIGYLLNDVKQPVEWLKRLGFLEGRI